MKKLLPVITAAAVLLLLSGCMGTFETARVVPLKIGATYFKTIESDNDEDDDGSIDIFGDDGMMSYTLGTMVEFGSGSGWMLAAEIEGGDVWVSPGVGVGLIKEF